MLCFKIRFIRLKFLSFGQSFFPNTLVWPYCFVRNKTSFFFYLHTFSKKRTLINANKYLSLNTPRSDIWRTVVSGSFEKSHC